MMALQIHKDNLEKVKNTYDALSCKIIYSSHTYTIILEQCVHN